MSPSPSTGGHLPASPRVLGLVGLGLIGTSIARAARRRWPTCRIVGVDRPDVLLHPAIVDTIDLASSDLQALIDADIVVLAAPVDAIRALLPQLAAVAPQARLILDAGSTKQAIVEGAAAAGLTKFIGGHPMAGAAAGGPDLSRADLFDGRRWFLVDTPDGELLASARAFVEGLGARVEVVDAATHDLVMAAVSHLPQVVASVLMALVDETVDEARLGWAGGGLRDTTRLAASPPGMWTSVLAANAQHLAPLLIELGGRLQRIAQRLDDPAAVARAFHAANAGRARLDRE